MRMIIRPFRKIFLALLMLATFILGGASLALAQLNAQNAKPFVETLVADVLAAVNADMGEAERFRLFEQIFKNYAEVPLIARKALGPSYRGASDAQRAAYQAAFSGYMARFYGGRYFSAFRGATIQTGKVREVAGGYLVDATVSTQQYSPYLSQWHIIDAKGQAKAYNIFVEGVSLLSDIRTQIGAILDKNGGDLDKTIAYLKTAR